MQLQYALGLAARGQPQVALVVGDAGIGKTTLVADLAQRAGDLGFATARGQCLDIQAEIPLGPAVAAVRGLLAKVDEGEDRPQSRRMRQVLDPRSPEVESVRLLDDLRLAFLEAAAAGPVLIVFEDLHWADRSTQDLVAALARTASGRMLLTLTVRTEDLPRRHHFRTTLAEIGRTEIARTIELQPLDREGVATLVATRTGSVPSPGSLASIVERSEGNPLYVEELLAAEALAAASGMPEHLADLLRARVDRLSHDTQLLLRAASVDGTRLDTEVLVQVAGCGHDELEAYLREAFDSNVLRQTHGHLEFRHGLIREAVYDDLLPDERTRTHGAVAKVLETRIARGGEPSLSDLSRAAFHWREAKDLPQALAASVRAGIAAKRFGAAEGVHHLGYALSIWDEVPDAEELTHQHRPDLLVMLSEAYDIQGDHHRMHASVREAVRLLGPDADPLLASRVYGALGRCWLFTDETLDEAEAVRRSLELAGDEPSEELAHALDAKARYLERHDHFAESVEWARRAIEVSRATACTAALTSSLVMSALGHWYLGGFAEAIRQQSEAVQVGRDAGRLGEAMVDARGLCWFLVEAGRVEEGASRARELLEEGRSQGLDQVAAVCGGVLQNLLVLQGRFAESEVMLEELVSMGLDSQWVMRYRPPLLLARGEAEEAKPDVMADIEAEAQLRGLPYEVDIETRTSLFCMLGEWSRAMEIAESFLIRLEESDSPLRHASGAYSGFRTLNFAKASGVEVPPGLRSLARGSVLRAREGYAESWRPSCHGTRLLLAEAYECRLEGLPTSDRLRGVLDLAAPFGAYFALEPRLLLAEDLLTHGGRDEGRELLVQVWADAHQMGARDYERQASKLATRTRVPLPEQAADAGPLNRLTPREREVLDLLAEGATNRAIADALFISEKTASVHVSHVLSKLGVPNRGAAAALAHRYA
jgi:DNA-binding CsgD family transcriptional regulator